VVLGLWVFGVVDVGCLGCVGCFVFGLEGIEEEAVMEVGHFAERKRFDESSRARVETNASGLSVGGEKRP